MRKREIQSFTLKLNDLSEYEAMRMENRASSRSEKDGMGPSSAAGGSAQQKQAPPMFKFGPKSKQEIRGRLGFME